MTWLDDRRLFILKDDDPGLIGAKEVTKDQAKLWNQKGFGVFWTINDFEGKDRVKENLTTIRSWYFEIDEWPKSIQLAYIEQGLVPSLIIESKKSYHVYFFAKGAKDVYRDFEIIQRSLIYYYAADPKIKDPLRLLRAPGFLHLKDEDEPFPVKVVWYKPLIRYTPDVMKYFYKSAYNEVAFKKKQPQFDIPKTDLDLFVQIFHLNHKDVLEKFSGSPYVNGEVYTFKQNRNGNLNIIVDGRSTHCFIDKEGRIGAVGGGPTIWQWLKWFGHKPLRIKQIIREVLGI